MLLGVICCCQEGRDQDQGLEAEKRPGRLWPGNGSPRNGTQAEAVEARRVKEEVGAGEEASPCWPAPWHPSLGLSPSEPPPPFGWTLGLSQGLLWVLLMQDQPAYAKPRVGSSSLLWPPPPHGSPLSREDRKSSRVAEEELLT